VSGPLFAKVLVANRGEIACRIFRTLGRMGIPSVAVVSEADRESLHGELADESVEIGPGPAAQSYLNIDALVAACRRAGATAVHPGYGFLSENAEFARRLEAEGIRFIGPSPQSLETFGLKHRAREAAVRARVPLLPGTGLLGTLAEAQDQAETLGWPVILKSTGGGGGIGMRICRTPGDLDDAFESVRSLAGRNFRDSGVYLERYVERARHVEVQIFGDGRGGVAVLGDRDCSAQRRNQKVIEECPAPGLTDDQRRELHAAAQRLTASERYGSAGTVEFVFDVDRGEFAFLEVNTRLQVEHTVTEEVWGIDLVEWMVRQAAGQWSVDEVRGLGPRGHAFQARLYAEDPGKGFAPCDGLVTGVHWPPGARVETWIRPGVVVGTHYDPLLAKIIVAGATREKALDALKAALGETRVGGLETNRSYLAAMAGDPTFREARMTTQWLARFQPAEPAFEVVRPGTLTTVQDWPGRLGHWMVGIPPSGPMDSLSHRICQRLVGNPEGTAGLEITLEGPTLRFRGAATAAWGGADGQVLLDGTEVAPWAPFPIREGQTLTFGSPGTRGQRRYLALAGGIDVPDYLGSRSTFTLGGFGGHGGRALKTGDVVPWGQTVTGEPAPAWTPPVFEGEWSPAELRVMWGPQGAPDYFRADDLGRLLEAEWEVHFNSSRTGVRLVGPVPDWPRTDGGEAGLHPSNLHDNAYAVGALDFTGDMPVLLGPDGPSLGGFVCPFTVISADLWKLGQLRPGTTLRFRAVSLEEAREAARRTDDLVARRPLTPVAFDGAVPGTADLGSWTDPDGRAVSLRRSGDRAVLLEVGPPVLDLELRLAIQWWHQRVQEADFPGILDLTPGIRSLQLHFDDHQTRLEDLVEWLRAQAGPVLAEVEVPSRTVWLPLSWDDPSTRTAIAKYMSSVRADAPWCPWNIEFIRRINGLERWEEVRDIVFQARYLVLGLGDVYLGAPVATPLDPRHRLVTTKYNPARTWTPENAVGIGGAYLCVYGMEGPGGYQFVGRTVPMWNRWFQTRDFPLPWLLRFFDQIRFYPVTTEELAALRRDLPLGKTALRIEEGTFRWSDYRQFLEEAREPIEAFGRTQRAAFAQERQSWKDLGLDTFQSEAPPAVVTELSVPPGCLPVESPLSGSVWRFEAAVGDRVEKGQVLVILDSMKMEILLESPAAGTVEALYRAPGDTVSTGQVLAAIRTEEAP
jgi:urea carboxylase